MLTIIFGTIYTVVQQNYRMSANDPQIQVAESVANALDSGKNPQDFNLKSKIDLQKSLATFIVIYDNSGNSIASSAFLNNKVPVPPAGVFDFVRANGQDRVTWQPMPGVRIATVVEKYGNGFVLSGQSLKEVEKRENNLFTLVAFGYLSSVVLLLLANLILRKKKI